MKKLIFSTILISISFISFSQKYKVDTIAYNGNITNLTNIVFLGDGYTAPQLDSFIINTKSIITDFFKTSPFKEYSKYFNVFAIRTPSNQSGAKHPKTTTDNDCSGVPISNPDNFYGSSFDNNGIHRLILPTKMNVVSTTLANNFPYYDIVIIVVNTKYYGGSGGAYATVTLNQPVEVTLHEVGHSFGILGDEYWAGISYAREAPNRTKESKPTLVKWKNWLNINNIGIYPFPEDTNWHRPHQNCKMRYLNVPFCSVCKETIIEKIHSSTSPIVNYNIDSTNISRYKFSLNLLKPNPNTIKIGWILNGNKVLTNKDSLILLRTNLVGGQNTISANIIDTTLMSKSINHATAHLYKVSWTLNSNNTGIKSHTEKAEISIFPNPFCENLSIKSTFQTQKQLKINIINSSGIVCISESFTNSGSQEETYTIDPNKLAKLTNGIYFVVLYIDGQQAFTKKVLKM